nr:hypothetical protein [Tanacetum cinerariifolium]
MAIDGVGWDWSYMVNEEDHALVDDGEDPTEFALMANIKNKLFDNSLCLNECKKNTDSLNSKIKDLKSELSEANNFIYHYKLAVAQLEGRLTEYKERERNALPSPTVLSTSAKGQNKDSSTTEDVASPNPPKPFVKFVKPKDSQPESKSKEQETPKKSQVKYAEQYRHSNKRPKGNQRNWNNLKSYELGEGSKGRQLGLKSMLVRVLHTDMMVTDHMVLL